MWSRSVTSHKAVYCSEEEFLGEAGVALARIPGRGNSMCQGLEAYLLPRKEHRQELEPGGKVWQWEVD